MGNRLIFKSLADDVERLHKSHLAEMKKVRLKEEQDKKEQIKNEAQKFIQDKFQNMMLKETWHKVAIDSWIPYQVLHASCSCNNINRECTDELFKSKCDAMSLLSMTIQQSHPGFWSSYDSGKEELSTWQYHRCHFIIAPEKYKDDAYDDLKRELNRKYDGD